jgi:hypothetical protein
MLHPNLESGGEKLLLRKMRASGERTIAAAKQFSGRDL